MVYFFRNLLISLAVVIVVVLLIVLRTFSTLQSQEKQQEKIIQSRDALQKLGPAIINMQEFEFVASRYINRSKNDPPANYGAVKSKLESDSASLLALGEASPADAPLYRELCQLIHQMLYSSDKEIAAGQQALLVKNFKETANILQDRHRELLNRGYGRSIDLTRRTFVFVQIISGLLLLILLISAWFIYHDIKTQKETAEKLTQFNAELEKQVGEKAILIRRNEEKYRSLFESMTDAYAKMDMDGRLIEFNPSFKNMVGYSEEELYGMTYRQITPPKWHKMVEDILKEQVITRGYSDVFEKEYIHKDGKIFTVELKSFLVRDDSGKKPALWAIIRDISERKEAEKKLSESEKNLRHVLSSTSDNFYVIDRDYRITLINDAAAANLKSAWGHPVSVGTNILDIMPRNSDEPIQASLDKVFEGQPVEYELKLTQDDLPPWVTVTYTPVVNEDGMIIGASIATKNITERKKTELELVEAESKFRNLVEQSLVGVYIIHEGKFAYVNPRFAAMFGYQPNELIASMPLENVIHPDDRDRVRENVRARVTGEKSSVHYEANGLKKTGELIRIEVFCNGTLYEGGTAIIGTVLDITQRKIVEEEKDRVRYLLNERVKELTSLYQVSQAFQREKKSIPEILQEVVLVLPQGWQYPEIAAARIAIGETEYRSPNFGTAVHRQATVFPTPDGKQGSVEVIYLEQRPPSSEDAFLFEERNLINMVAEMIRIYLARQHEADRNKIMQQEILNQKVQEQKTVTRAVLNAEESERNKIARELHDNVNQILASIKLFIQIVLTKEIAGGHDILVRTVKLVDDAIQAIRVLSQSHVTPLKKVHLKELIESLIDRLHDSTSIKAILICEEDKEFDEELKLNIYRIVQEQINNILKYADATEVTIRIDTKDNALYVSIADNGRGFDPAARRKGIGISNMINRVESFNGVLDIISSPGNGCTIGIRIPC